MFRLELARTLAGTGGLAFVAGFSMSLAICVFLIADFYASDEASVRLLLVFVPWIALVFLPALGMRAFSSEDGEMELLLNVPCGELAICLAKYLAGSVPIGLALAASAPFVLTVSWLGDPDFGAVAGAYLGAVTMLAFAWALVLFAASLARERVGAYVLASSLLFAFMLAGLDVARRLPPAGPLEALVRALGELSPARVLDAAGDGLLEGERILYALMAIVVFLVGAAINLARRRLAAGPAARTAADVTVLVTVLVAVAAGQHLSARVELRADLSEQGVFTMSEGLRAIAAHAPAVTRVRLYWSESEASVPVAIKTHARRIRRMLRSLADESASLTFELVDPWPDSDEALQARAEGIQWVPMTSGDNFFLGASFVHGERRAVVPYFDTARDHQLEYDIGNALEGLARERPVHLGVLSPLVAPRDLDRPREGMSFLDALKREHDVSVIPYFRDELPGDLDVLVVMDASVLRREMLYAIDQHVMRGGGLVVLLDPHVRFSPSSNQLRVEPSSKVNDISDLLLAYGLRYQPGAVVGDRDLAATVGGSDGGAMRFPFWLRVPADRLSQQHPVTAGLNELLFAEAGQFELLPGAEAQALVSTTAHSGTLASDRFARFDARSLALELITGDARRTVAAYVSGTLASAYSASPQGASDENHLVRTAKAGRVFAVADVDWMFDPFAVQRVELDGTSVMRPLNDNLALLMNMIEYAAGGAALIELRAKRRLARPFTRVRDLFAAAEVRYRAEEARLAEQAAAAEKLLSEKIEAGQAAGPSGISAATRDEIVAAEQSALPARRALREIRRRMREDAQSLGRQVTAFNLLSWPACGMLLWWALRLARRRWIQRTAATLGRAPLSIG
ncbi:MAG: Gldg family protein [Gammaproteobacteria bacterium]